MNWSGGNKQLAMSSMPSPSATGREASVTNRIDLAGKRGISQLVWGQQMLDQVRSYVGESYVSRSGRGHEVGGVVFGRRLGELAHVAAWRPMPRGEDATAHFYLNERDEQGLKKLLSPSRSDSALKGLEVLGWFRSRIKGEAILDETDLAFHAKFFSAPVQFAMVIKPSHQRPAHAAIFMRENDGEFTPQVPTATLTLQPGATAVSNGEASQGRLPEVHIDRMGGRPPREVPWGRIATLATTATLAVGLTIAALQWNVHRADAAPTQPPFKLNVDFEGDELKAMWDPTSPALLKAGAARLEWQGGQIELSGPELTQGYRRVPLSGERSGDIVISLNAGNIEESAHIITAARKF